MTESSFTSSLRSRPDGERLRERDISGGEALGEGEWGDWSVTPSSEWENVLCGFDVRVGLRRMEHFTLNYL